MMQKRDFEEAVEAILERDDRYQADAYVFVRDALDYTLKHLGSIDAELQGQHVSGRELLDGFRRYSLKEFGPMTKTVFAEWGIEKSRDVGEIVFNLIEEGIFGKTENDHIDDFTDVFDFDEAFLQPFLPKQSASVESSSS